MLNLAYVKVQSESLIAREFMIFFLFFKSCLLIACDTIFIEKGCEIADAKACL